MADLEVIVTGAASGDAETIEALSCQVLDCMAGVAAERGADLPPVRLVVSEGYEAALEAEASRLAVSLEQAVASAEGSTPYGRTLRNSDWTQASVVVKLQLRTIDGPALVRTLCVVAHEFGHVLYGACEREAVGVREELPLRFRAAEIAVMHAAEEFRVERLSQVVLESLGCFVDERGPIRLADLEEGAYRNGLPKVTAECAQVISRSAAEFATGAMPAETFWVTVLGELQSFVQLVAYAEANCVGHPPAFDGIVSSNVELLRPLWEPFIDHVGHQPLVPSPGDWASDALAIQTIGAAGVARVLQALGINVDMSGRVGTPATMSPSWSP